ARAATIWASVVSVRPVAKPIRRVAPVSAPFQCPSFRTPHSALNRTTGRRQREFHGPRSGASFLADEGVHRARRRFPPNSTRAQEERVGQGNVRDADGG